MKRGHLSVAVVSEVTLPLGARVGVVDCVTALAMEEKFVCSALACSATSTLVEEKLAA